MLLCFSSGTSRLVFKSLSFCNKVLSPPLSLSLSLFLSLSPKQRRTSLFLPRCLQNCTCTAIFVIILFSESTSFKPVPNEGQKQSPTEYSWDRTKLKYFLQNTFSELEQKSKMWYIIHYNPLLPVSMTSF